MEQYQELAEVLEKNLREDWPQILADYFKVEISLVETICEAFNEIEPERFRELVYGIPSFTKTNFYKEYINGQLIVPSEEEVQKAFEIEKKILNEGGQPQEIIS